MSCRLSALIFCALALAAAGSPARAQDVPVPDQADPGRAARQLPFPDRPITAAPQAASGAEREATAIPAWARDVTFTLNAVEVDGMTVYGGDDIRPLIEPRLGETVSLAFAYTLADALTEKYREDGYFLSRVIVPQQDIKNGRLHLTAVEGRIGQIRLEAPKDLKTDFLTRYAAPKPGPARLGDLERALLLMNDLPGMQVGSVLSPGALPGTTDVTLTASEKPVEGRVSFDNYGSDYLGPWQASALLAFNNWQGENERFELQAGAAPRSTADRPELGFLGLKYSQPVGRWGTVFETSTFYAGTRPGEILADFDVNGYTEYAYAGLKHPVLRSRAKSLWARLGVDARVVQSESAIDIPRQDDLRVARAGLTGTWLGTSLGLSHNVIDLEISKGLSGLGASQRGDPWLTRAEGRPQFLKAIIEGQRLQALTGKLNALFGLKAQKANAPLLTAEEFGLGGFGSGYGRGYDPSEIAGDDALAGKIELQWNNPAPLDWLENYQAYGFYDLGAVWNQDPSDPSLARRSLASAGAGLRIDITPLYQADLSVALPLTREVEIEQSSSPRFYVSVARSF